MRTPVVPILRRRVWSRLLWILLAEVIIFLLALRSHQGVADEIALFVMPAMVVTAIGVIDTYQRGDPPDR